MGDDVFGTSNISERSNNNPSKSSGISINGSSFALQNDPIAAKREEARKKAMKIIGDAFANDRKIDEDLDARSEHIRKLKAVQNDANKTINEIESDRVALRDEYGIDANSQEEKELQLLEKEFRARQKGSDVQLTKEDKEEIIRGYAVCYTGGGSILFKNEIKTNGGIVSDGREYVNVMGFFKMCRW